MNKLLIKIDNLEDRDGCALVTLTGPNASVFAKFHQSFCDSTWEISGDDFAYCMPLDNDKLTAEAAKLMGEQFYFNFADLESEELRAHVAVDLSECC